MSDEMKCPLCHSTKVYVSPRVLTCTACGKSVDVDEDDSLRHQLAAMTAKRDRLLAVVDAAKELMLAWPEGDESANIPELKVDALKSAIEAAEAAKEKP